MASWSDMNSKSMKKHYVLHIDQGICVCATVNGAAGWPTRQPTASGCLLEVTMVDKVLSRKPHVSHNLPTCSSVNIVCY